MKTVILFTLSFISSLAFGAEDVLYCGGLGIQGSYLKILPNQKKMCISAGQWGLEYCSTASKTFEIIDSRTGSLNVGGKDFSFREFVGTDGSKTQFVRVFNEASNPSGADIVIHRADLAGPFLLINVGRPDAEAKDGEPTCLEGDDSSF